MKLLLYAVLFSSYISPNCEIGEYIFQVTSFKNFSTIWQAWQSF